MPRQFFPRLRAAMLGTASLLLLLNATPSSHGHGGGHGGGGHAGAYHGGFYHGGLYHGGLYHGGLYHGGFYRPYYGYGFYRPYYGYGLGGFGLGYGLGLGLGSGLGGYGLGGYGLGGYGLGGYGLGGYGLGGYGAYVPYYGASVYAAAPGGTPPSNLYANGTAPSPAQQPPPDNAAHLQLAVPQNAVVIIDGEKTNQTGSVREFVSPPLDRAGSYNYRISVRYTDANGKPVNDTRTIHVRANDWFRIDFTRPAPPDPLPQPSPLKE